MSGVGLRPRPQPAPPSPAPASERARPGFRLGYRPGLDGIRGLALLGVVAFHAKVAWLPGGHLGVDMFFVLSGFLITVLLVQEFDATGRVDLMAFYRRRSRRIFPALVAFSVLMGLFVQAVATPETAAAQWRAVLAAVTGVINWFTASSGRPTLLVTHTWSVAVEIQFYLAWALLLAVLLRRHADRGGLVRVLAAVIVTVVVVRGAWWYGWNSSRLYPRLFAGTDMRLDHLMTGAALALIAVQGRLPSTPRGRRLLRLAVLPATAYLAVTWLTLADWGLTMAGGSTLTAVATAVLIAGCLTVPQHPFLRVLAAQPLRWCGRVSYGVYLWHVPIYRLLREHAPHWSLATQAWVGAALAFVLGAASFYLLERRFLRPRRRPAETAGGVEGTVTRVPRPQPSPQRL